MILKRTGELENMKAVRDKWFFYTGDRKPLDASEVSYWKTTLSKILKVGYEFEFNLPEKKNGTCKGGSNLCPCSMLSIESTCWKKCAKEAACPTLMRKTSSCLNVTGTCEDHHCSSCEHFSSNCSGIACVNFVSHCIVCEDYKLPCSGCEYVFDPSKSPNAIRQALSDVLAPSKSYGQINPSGVHSITTDGSLLGGDSSDSKKKGAEIITVGRRVDFWEFYKMTKLLIDEAVRRGAYMTERCSTHMHLLGSYYGKVVQNQESYGIPSKISELERDMPEIILANLHQLVRRYQNAITWMTMALNEPERMTRWEKFRVSVLPVSAVMKRMHSVQQKVSANAGGSKYSWINYNLLDFAESGDVRRFHVEFRVCDGLMSPSASAAIACMFYALAIKAVEISRYGVLEAGDDAWLEKSKEIKASMMNNMKGWGDGDRFSDTKNVMKYKDILVEESMDLVMQLKSTLCKVGPAYEILEKLAEKPIALRRCEGESWEEIEDSLKVITSPEDNFAIKMCEIISLNIVRKCEDMGQWIRTAASFMQEDLKVDDDTAIDLVSSFINNKQNDGDLIWSKQIGAPLLLK